MITTVYKTVSISCDLPTTVSCIVSKFVSRKHSYTCPPMFIVAKRSTISATVEFLFNNYRENTRKTTFTIQLK